MMEKDLICVGRIIISHTKKASRRKWFKKIKGKSSFPFKNIVAQ
jgi:hypothetical protein